MNIDFEISKYGNLLMYKPGYSADTVKDLIDSEGLNGLRIFDHWEPIESTDFLRGFSFLKRLELAFRYDQDYSFLRDLPQLEVLEIGPSYPMKNQIDLAHQVNLKSLALQWRKKRIIGLEACQKLEHLCLIEFSERNLTSISTHSKLERLRIKTGSMKTLEGIGYMKNLELLEIGNCRDLSSITQMNGLESLRDVKFETCRKISDYDGLRDLPLLSSIKLIDCGEIPNLDYKNRFPSLIEFELLGKTKMKDVNAS